MYKEIQIITKAYNEIHRALFIPTFIMLWLVVFVICCYIVIAHYPSIGFISTVMFAVTTIMGQIAILFCLNFPASVYSKSVLSIKEVGSAFDRVQVTCRKHSRMKMLRQIRSLAVTRIGFSGSNYIDKLTPLTFLQFGIDKVVSLILLG